VADNLLLTSYLSARSPVMVAPAMDLDMYRHPSTTENLETLSKRGVLIVEPSSGELASGLDGKGRMEEPEIIVERIKKVFNTSPTLSGKKILITAGPTREEIDPVRYITNHSSGKMGYAIAQECAERGALVTLISGPTSIEISSPLINKIDVVSAAEMYQNTVAAYESGTDVVILSAAVADFTPVDTASKKIKRGKENYSLELKPTKDIAAELGNHKRENTIHIGFALETDNELANANDKLHRKNLDAIVLNSLKDEGAGFGTDTNKVSIIGRDGSKQDYNLKSKRQVASDIVDYIEKLLSC